MIGALKILQDVLNARTAPSNHMAPATNVASADSNHAVSIAGFFFAIDHQNVDDSVASAEQNLGNIHSVVVGGREAHGTFPLRWILKI